MSDSELLASIRRRLDQDDGLLESCRSTLGRNSLLLERVESRLDRVDETLDGSDALILDTARHLDTAMKRSDALTEHMIGRLEALTDAIRSLIDRLDGGSAPA